MNKSNQGSYPIKKTQEDWYIQSTTRNSPIDVKKTWAYAMNHTPNHVRNEVGGQLKNIRNQGRITLDTFSIIRISIFSFIWLHPSIYLFFFNFFSTQNQPVWSPLQFYTCWICQNPHTSHSTPSKPALLILTNIITTPTIYLTFTQSLVSHSP